MDWISVEERLPEGGALVLVLISEGADRYPTYAIAWFRDFFEMGPAFDGANVTHWMPLPPPPQPAAPPPPEVTPPPNTTEESE